MADKTRPALGLDEVLSVAFAGRPKDMGACVGHFANSLPVKIPIWKALGADGSSRGFRSLVAAVSKNMSAVKTAEMIAPIEVSRACREMNIDYQPPRVAVTYSPKLARTECRLFPVEGSWDLFFCFLEYEDDVKLGVCILPSRAGESRHESLLTLVFFFSKGHLRSSGLLRQDSQRHEAAV